MTRLRDKSHSVKQQNLWSFSHKYNLTKHEGKTFTRDWTCINLGVIPVSQLHIPHLRIVAFWSIKAQLRNAEFRIRILSLNWSTQPNIYHEVPRCSSVCFAGHVRSWDGIRSITNNSPNKDSSSFNQHLHIYLEPRKKCPLPEYKVELSPGESYKPVDSCAEYTCEKDLTLSGKLCPKIQSRDCSITMDKTTLYPDCCPRPEC